MTGVNPPNYHLLLDPGTVPGRRSGCVPPGPGRPARRTYLIMGLAALIQEKELQRRREAAPDLAVSNRTYWPA